MLILEVLGWSYLLNVIAFVITCGTIYKLDGAASGGDGQVLVILTLIPFVGWVFHLGILITVLVEEGYFSDHSDIIVNTVGKWVSSPCFKIKVIKKGQEDVVDNVDHTNSG